MPMWRPAMRRESGVTCDGQEKQPLQRIDYCFASASMAPNIRRAWIDNEAVGSDHQPIWTEIEL